ncbi:TPA: hypothetical protein JG825_003488 [Vibrio parahaemolyticus]|uniref:hypothetical protein n=1 Tax=Vibrio campbellii TaxID=680 RepID=UPI00215BBEAE|nr:hypothetical protein [Vibrio campbellii]MCR9909694.1 hypothetical protein [Vibrio campbellii]HAV1520169.1 hypothetical protein [Vibrio parahaemolyticus]
MEIPPVGVSWLTWGLTGLVYIILIVIVDAIMPKTILGRSFSLFISLSILVTGNYLGFYF